MVPSARAMGSLGEDAVDFCGGDWGAVGGGEFAIEIRRGEGGGAGREHAVAEAVALGMSGEGTAASIGESKLATVFGRFGAFRSHAERVPLYVYSCLVYRRLRAVSNGGGERSNANVCGEQQSAISNRSVEGIAATSLGRGAIPGSAVITDRWILLPTYVRIRTLTTAVRNCT